MYVSVKVLDLGFSDICELLCRCRELNLGPQEGKPVLLVSIPQPKRNHKTKEFQDFRNAKDQFSQPQTVQVVVAEDAYFTG